MYCNEFEVSQRQFPYIGMLIRYEPNRKCYGIGTVTYIYPKRANSRFPNEESVTLTFPSGYTIKYTVPSGFQNDTHPRRKDWMHGPSISL